MLNVNHQFSFVQQKSAKIMILLTNVHKPINLFITKLAIFSGKFSRVTNCFASLIFKFQHHCSTSWPSNPVKIIFFTYGIYRYQICGQQLWVGFSFHTSKQNGAMKRAKLFDQFNSLLLTGIFKCTLGYFPSSLTKKSKASD